MNPGTPSQPIALKHDLTAVLTRLRACAAYDGRTLTELLEDVADDLEVQQQSRSGSKYDRNDGERIIRRLIPSVRHTIRSNAPYDFRTRTGVKLEVKFASQLQPTGAFYWRPVSPEEMRVADRLLLVGLWQGREFIWDIPMSEYIKHRSTGLIVKTPLSESCWKTRWMNQCFLKDNNELTERYS